MGSAWRNAKRALGLNLCVHVPRPMGDEEDDMVRRGVSAEGLRASDAAATASPSPRSSMHASQIISRTSSTPTPSSDGLRMPKSGSRSSKVWFLYIFLCFSTEDFFLFFGSFGARTKLICFSPVILLWKAHLSVVHSMPIHILPFTISYRNLLVTFFFLFLNSLQGTFKHWLWRWSSLLAFALIDLSIIFFPFEDQFSLPNQKGKPYHIFFFY